MDDFVIEWLRGQTVATITAPNGSALKTRVQKLSIEHPEDCQVVIENKDGSILAHVPVKYIKLNPPKQVSEETLARLRNYRAKNHPNSALNDSAEDLPTEY